MPAAHRLLVVFVDALGPAQIRRFDERLHFVPHRQPMAGVLGYSSGALPTLLTGSPPAAHGRMCLFSAGSDDGPGVLRPLRWLGILPRWVHERPFLRMRLARITFVSQDKFLKQDKPVFMSLFLFFYRFQTFKMKKGDNNYLSVY